MRRLISLVSVAVALVGLGLVLYNATLVDRRAPAVVGIALSSPAGDDRIAQTLTAINIQFSEPVRTATVESRFRIEPYIAGAFTWDGTMLIFTPSAQLPEDTAFAVRIEPGFEDLIGNVAETVPEAWAFRTVGPPVVVRAVPGDGATGLPVDGGVELTFDRLMDTTSVEAALRIEPAAALDVAWSGETVRLSFAGPLAFGTSYTLTIGRTAADTGGNRLQGPYRLRFTTVAAGLSVIDAIPSAGVAGVGILTSVAVRFDRPIDPDSARAAFHIAPSVDGEIRVVIIADDRPQSAAPAAPADPDTLVFLPNDGFAPHTTYTVTIAPTVASLGDPAVVAAGRTWSFTTGSPSISAQNQIAFLGARSGVRNVWLMNPDGTNARQLTTELVPVSGFDVTDDGARVAFSAGGVVSIADIDGSGARRLSDEAHFEYAPIFTPDDRAVIVGRRGVDGSDLGYWFVPLPGEPGDERQLLGSGAPNLGSAELGGEGIGDTDAIPEWLSRTAFDPTGRWALIVPAAGPAAVVDIGPAGEARGPTATSVLGSAAPAWSPRHRAFVLSGIGTSDGTFSGTPDLWTVAQSGSVARIAGTEGATGPVAVGADSAVAVQVRPADGGPASIWLMAAGAPSFVDLGASPGFDDRWPAFSPNDASLLIGRTDEATPTRGDGIWAIDLASVTVVQLAFEGTFARWLP
ncbi:MAG: hypothetical protein HW391_570 [Chloroflexi bacterium]|nr:hypothetical protein [Chloroflexota bacterium]